VRTVIVCVSVAIAGCTAGPVSTPPPPYDPCSQVGCIAPPAVRNKVDVLFVLDDSSTMGAALDTWRASLPRLVATLEGFAAAGSAVSYHFGVVTADLGAGPETLPALGCHPGGDGGKLRTGGVALMGGVRYLDDNLINGTRNVDGDVAVALAALADAGTAGCDFRHPLEAAYRALHDQIAENVGFLRADALLVVVFVGNADDCSAPPVTDLFDGSAAGVAAYGTLDRFRCTQFGIDCNGQPVPPMSVSGLTGCTPQTMATGGKLFDVQKYIDFFARPAAQGGVKVDPDDAILVGIAAPADPVGVTITSPCAADTTVSSCPQLNRSCISTSDARFFGDPAVRLSTVIAAVKEHAQTSVCDPSDDAAADNLGNLVLSRVTVGCLAAPVATLADGTPDCVVTDVTANADGTTSTTALPSCAQNGHVTPCWQLVDRLAQYEAQGCTPPDQPRATTCKLPTSCQPVTNPTDGALELYTVDVDRGSAPPPPNTGTRVDCATAR
jgi:hypothetical protein